MSNSAQRRWLSGRWQAPLAIAAVAIAAGVVMRFRPEPAPIDFEAVQSDLLALEAGQAFRDATDAAANLLSHDPAPSPEQQLWLHDYLVRVLHRQESVRGVAEPENVRLILEHAQHAAKLDSSVQPGRLLRVAQSHEWLCQTDLALSAYRELAGQTNGLDRRTALQALNRLLRTVPDSEAERETVLQALLTDRGLDPAELWEALRGALRAAVDQGAQARAVQMLEELGQPLNTDPYRGYYEFLRAWLAVEGGEFAAAWPAVQALGEWLDSHDGGIARFDTTVSLRALHAWLEGVIHLADGRPQAGLERLDEAAVLAPTGELFQLVCLARADALAALARDEAALAAVRAGVADMARGANRPEATRFVTGLMQLFAERYTERDFDSAIAYLSLAVDLVMPDEPVIRRDLLERLARVLSEAADAASDPAEKADFARSAAERFEVAADLHELDGAKAALLWESQSHFDAAGERAHCRRVLERFVKDRSEDARLPDALFRLGQLARGQGEATTALAWFEQVRAKFPKLAVAPRATLAAAECRIHLGEEADLDQAEQMLVALLDSGDITPQSEVYQRALLTLGELLFDRQLLAPAISRLEDYLAFAGDHADPQAGFLLADAYRLSAQELLESSDPAALPEASEEARRRLRRGAGLYQRFLSRELSSGESAVNESEADWRRLALLNLGDCLLGLDEPAAADEALSIFRQVGAAYEQDAAALVAQVRMALVLVRSGQVTEAARAIERSRWIVRNLPDRAFLPPNASRKEWERYLSVAAAAPLFRDVLEFSP